MAVNKPLKPAQIVSVAATVPSAKAVSKVSNPSTLGVFKTAAQKLSSKLDSIAEANKKEDVKKEVSSPSVRKP